VNDSSKIHSIVAESIPVPVRDRQQKNRNKVNTRNGRREKEIKKHQTDRQRQKNRGKQKKERKDKKLVEMTGRYRETQEEDGRAKFSKSNGSAGSAQRIQQKPCLTRS